MKANSTVEKKLSMAFPSVKLESVLSKAKLSTVGWESTLGGV
jgi:hypothetical protein